jgi:hypothetical protein
MVTSKGHRKDNREGGFSGALWSFFQFSFKPAL